MGFSWRIVLRFETWKIDEWFSLESTNSIESFNVLSTKFLIKYSNRNIAIKLSHTSKTSKAHGSAQFYTIDKGRWLVDISMPKGEKKAEECECDYDNFRDSRVFESEDRSFLVWICRLNEWSQPLFLWGKITLATRSSIVRIAFLAPFHAWGPRIR